MAGEVKNRLQIVLIFQEVISFMLKSMYSDQRVEAENLRSAIDTAQAGIEMLKRDLLEREAKRPN